MAKLVIGFLLGLVLGLYLDSTATDTGGQPLAQIEAAAKNLFSF